MNVDGPALVEFVVQPDICTPLVSPGKGLDNMILHDSVVAPVINPEDTPS